MGRQDKLSLFHTPDVAERAETFTPWCLLTCAKTPPSLAEGHALWLDRDGLGLVNAALGSMLRLDEQQLSPRLAGRSLLMKACGAHGTPLSILDPFAGFGLDGLLLAYHGHHLTLVEQETAIWLMLREFAATLGLTPKLYHQEATQFMVQATSTWDVVYLDPMFPARRKRALPNLGLQHLRLLAKGEGVDLQSCLSRACELANQRVVFKQRLKDPVIGRPSHQLKGQAVRFDVYL